jgi:exodeoxyribonuclease-3
MKIATYNINGVLGRLPLLLDWLGSFQPDVVCLQELKTDAARFPHAALRKAGYGSAWLAEGAYNGVALLCKGDDPIVTRRGLPDTNDEPDRQARYIECAVNGVLMASLYAPNGNPQPGPRFDYKLAWMQRLHEHAASLCAAGLPVLLAGDFNVVPTPRDMYASKSSWKDDALVQPEPRAAYQRLLALGFADALREKHPEAGMYTFWDYKRGAWSRDQGLRIDHLLLSGALASRLRDAGVDRSVRALERSSDHAPAWIVLD